MHANIVNVVELLLLALEFFEQEAMCCHLAFSTVSHSSYHVMLGDVSNESRPLHDLRRITSSQR